MKKIIIFLTYMFIVFGVSAQKVTYVIMMGPNGVTKNESEAQFFAIVKEYSGGKFERLDYNKNGPMRNLRTYKDAELMVLNGAYYEYNAAGEMRYAGQYGNNKKCGSWYTYEKLKPVLVTEYDNDTIVSERIYNQKDSLEKHVYDKEAEFKGGSKKWLDYITNSVYKKGINDRTKKGGKVQIGFTVDSVGTVGELFVFRSVDYFLDTESAAIIIKSPKWNPAILRGKPVSSTFSQPITYSTVPR